MTVLPDPARPLDAGAAHDAFAAILDGRADPEAIAGFLVALADRGETAAEIAAAARAMRRRMIAVAAPADAIDVCGTGGDGSHSLNISTAVAIVVAACGVPVAKHGNRAASSRAGAADTLEALGLDLDRAHARAERSLADIGIAFLFARAHHPALVALAPIRAAIGRRTIFNLLGPLASPAGVRRQLIGVASPALLPVYAEAAALLDPDAALIVSGAEGLDELSIAGVSHAAWAGRAACPLGQSRSGDIRLTPGDAGLPHHPADALKGGDPAYNATALRRLLAGTVETGQDRAYRDAVILNAAAALLVAGEATALADAAEDAAEAIDKGLAKALLDCWIAF